MIRNEEEEYLTEENPTVNIQIPKKKFRISVECPLFLIMTAITLTGSAMSNIILYRTCVHSLSHSHEECKGFLSPVRSNDTDYLEKDVQKYAMFVGTTKAVLESLGPAILSLFLGAWSNTYGRRPLITWSLFGMAMSSMLTVVYSLTRNLGPWWYIVTILPMSLTGSFVVLFTGAYCYISDVTPTDKTTLRMTLVDTTVSVGMVIGSLIAKDLILKIGNEFSLLLGATLNVLAYSYASVFIPESLEGAKQGGFSKVFDFSYVKELAQECFKARPNNVKPQIILLTSIRIIAVFVLYGTVTLDYMFTRNKLQWSLSDYNTYSAVGTAISFFGGFLGLYVGQHVLRISDILFAMFSVCTASAELFIKSFAFTSWHMYLGSTVSLFKGLSSPLLRSHLSKILSAEDVAKVFTIMCATESMTPLIAPVLFTAIYTTTINTFPGAIYLFGGILTLICVILLGLVQHYYSRRSTQVNYEPLSETDMFQQ